MFDVDVEQLVQNADQETLIGALSVLGLILVFAQLSWRRLRRGRGGRSVDAGGWSMSRPILWWSETEALTLGETYEGIFICGATGSGKTSGSARGIADGFLRAKARGRGGPGVIFFTVKPGDRDFFMELARNAGRSADVVILGQGQGFNFLQYESERGGTDLVENAADLLAIGCEIAQRGGTQGGGQEDANFWKNARQQLVRNAIVALNIAYGHAGVVELFAFVSSIPTTTKQAESKRFQKSSFCFKVYADALEKCQPEQETELALSARYCTSQLPAAGERTQGNVLLTLTSMADILVRGLAKQMLCSETTVTPKDLERGKIIIVDVPIAKYGLTGRLIQGIIRYCFQQAMLKRDVRQDLRPVLFFQDECQAVTSSHDAKFLSLCRAFNVANIFATQNLGNMEAACGGVNGKAETSSILGNLNLKIMHANGCPNTNKWVSECIGMSRQYKFSANNSYQPADVLSDVFGFGPGPSTNAGFSEEWQYEVQPAEFTRLRTGGVRHNYLIDAIAFQAGRVFLDTGRTWRRVTFRQKV
ncbi:MAG: TraM recognition domain-containing protein [Pirellulales bacterium]|nr:TraM recognition domain-containing protein [Pirellulales bacterium]